MTDSDDFDAFYVSRAPQLTRSLYLSTGDLTRAQDCVQEAFLRAWQRWGSLKGDDPVRWVHTVAWRLAIKDWHRVARQMRALRRHGAEPDVPPPLPEVLVVRNALAALPLAQRSVLVLHYFDDLPVRDIAHLLGLPEGTVKARLSRGRVALGEVLRAKEEDEAWTR